MYRSCHCVPPTALPLHSLPVRNSTLCLGNGRTFRGIVARDESYTYVSSLGNKDLTGENSTS